MKLDESISRHTELVCPKCYERKVGKKTGVKAEEAQTKVSAMLDQPSVFENVRQKICLVCGFKVAYYIRNINVTKDIEA